jgi:hypothetical protein
MHPQGTTILALGIIGLIVFQPLAIVAWVMGSKAKKAIEAGEWAPTSAVTTGRVLGIVGTIFLILGLLIVAVVAVLFFIFGVNILPDFLNFLQGF